MCLTLSDKTVQPIIAEKDIICYKWLIKRIDPSTIEDGSEFTATIKGIETSGRVSIFGNRVFFCTNDRRLDGTPCQDKKGYEYSWNQDVCTFNIKINGQDVSEILFTPYRMFPIIIGNEYKSNLIKKEDEIHEGIHSFYDLDKLSKRYYVVIAKCIIPKGSLYYEGKFNDHKSYASDRIKYIELVQ